MNVRFPLCIGEAIVPVFVASAPLDLTPLPNPNVWLSASPSSPAPAAIVNCARSPKMDETQTLHVQAAEILKPLTLGDERRFHQLAVQYALGTISQKDAVEMAALDRRRLVDEKPLPVATVIARERLLTKIDDLLREMNDFRRHAA